MAKVLLSAAFALLAAAIVFAVGPADAAVPDQSFGASVMGAEHAVLVALGNVLWWSAKVGIIAGLFMYVLSRPRIRDKLTAQEFNEAVALRRRYVADGGGEVEGKAKMSTGEAVYIVGVLFLDKLVAIVLTVLAVTAGAAL